MILALAKSAQEGKLVSRVVMLMLMMTVITITMIGGCAMEKYSSLKRQVLCRKINGFRNTSWKEETFPPAFQVTHEKAAASFLRLRPYFVAQKSWSHNSRNCGITVAWFARCGTMQMCTFPGRSLQPFGSCVLFYSHPLLNSCIIQTGTCG